MLGKLTVGVIWSPLADAENIYIGRGSKMGPSVLGNPFIITGSCSREESVEKYREYLIDELNQNNQKVMGEMNRIATLIVQGKDVNLLCYCKHKDQVCHGDSIKEIIDDQILEYQARNDDN